MTVWRLVFREIVYRKLNFLLVALAVMVAIGALVSVVTLLRAHDIRTGEIINARIDETNRIIRARQSEANAEGAVLEETYRKLMLKSGYDLVILPKDEGLVSYQLEGPSSKTMSESNVRTLSDSKINIIRHLLPILQRKQVILFGDQRREVFLVGTRGEVPIAHRNPKKPLQDSVGENRIIVGHLVAKELGLALGDTVKIIDREFEVIRIYDARGTTDDASVWIALKTAQQLLGQPGRINAILALSCNCTRAELDALKIQIAGILPDTRVHVMMTDAVIRYHARDEAHQTAQRRVATARDQGAEDIRREKAARARLKGDIESLAAWMVPLMLFVSAAFTAMMALVNVRERRAEIGIWRALGLPGRQIFTIFLAKALLAGLLGACVGYPVGFFIASAWPQAPARAALFDPIAATVALLLAPVLAVAAEDSC